MLRGRTPGASRGFTVARRNLDGATGGAAMPKQARQGGAWALQAARQGGAYLAHTGRRGSV